MPRRQDGADKRCSYANTATSSAYAWTTPDIGLLPTSSCTDKRTCFNLLRQQLQMIARLPAASPRVFFYKTAHSHDEVRSLTRFNKICHPSQRPRWQVDKEAIGLSRVQQCSSTCITRPPEICVNLVFKHIHAASSYTIRRQFVPFIYCAL